MNNYDIAISKLESYLNELLEEKELLAKSVYKNNKEVKNYEYEIAELEKAIEECKKKLDKLATYKQDKRTIRKGYFKKLSKNLLIVVAFIEAGLIANSVTGIMVKGFIDSVLNNFYLVVGAVLGVGVIGLEAIEYFF